MASEKETRRVGGARASTGTGNKADNLTVILIKLIF